MSADCSTLTDAFFSCKNLSSVSIGESVTRIGGCSFSVCRGLYSITIPENVTGEAVEEIRNNTALDNYTPVNLPEGAELEIELKSVGETIVYDVTPIADGTEVEPTQPITFRLPVPASVTEAYANVYHEGTLMGIYAIQGEGNAKYVEISSADFSVYTVEPVSPVHIFLLIICQ